MTLKVGVLGSTGRMGQAVLSALGNDAKCTLALAGERETSRQVFVSSDVVVDFTVPEALPSHIDLALKYVKPLVVGTTGLTSGHYEMFSDVSSTLALVVSSNMSLGVTLLAHFVEQAARFLDETYDIEIGELHHRYKKDAPSGTAIKLGEVVARGRGKRLDTLLASSSRQGQRLPGTIGFSVQRGGHVVGDHAVRFLGDDEILEFSHRGLSRAAYAQGALRAAQWVVSQKPGLYSMADVLGISGL